MTRTRGDHDVHVCWARLPPALDEGERSACFALLSESERERHARFLVRSAADEYLVAHVLVRTLLSRFADVAPNAWRFRMTDRGRPEIAGAPGGDSLRFNLSHSSRLIACAVANGRDIGIDIEAIDGRQPVPVHLAERFFAPSEASAIRAAPLPDRARLFCALWTLKEAYLKARGLGLSVRLDWVTFALQPGLPISAALHPALGDTPDAWEFRLERPTSRHMLALAFRRTELPSHIHVEEIDTLGLVNGYLLAPPHQCWSADLVAGERGGAGTRALLP